VPLVSAPPISTATAWSRARAAADELLAGLPAGAPQGVLDALEPALRQLLVDAGGGVEQAAQALVVHTAEALVAERLVAVHAGAPVSWPRDPAALLFERLDPDRLAAARGDLDRWLARVDPLAQDPFGSSFPSRANKRRGGVYTDPDLVELVLDLVGWEGRGRLLEPAVGAGAFLLGAWRRQPGAARSAPRDGLFGVDVHPYACRAARAALSLAGAEATITRADALLGTQAAPTAERGTWDFVVGNPPWVRGERVPAALRAEYRTSYPDLGAGNVDLAAYFVRRALDWLRPDGRLGFVLTAGLADARSSAGLRALLATRTIEAVVGLEWAGALFPGASVIPLVLVVRNAPPARGHQVRVGTVTGPLHEGVRWTRVRQATWLELAAHGEGRWPLSLGRGDVSLLRHLAQAPRPLRASYGLALRTRVPASELIAASPEQASRRGFTAPRPLLDGREVRAWALEPAGRVLDYRRDLISDPKCEAFFAGPKVLVPRIALTLQAAVDESREHPFFARNTVMIVRAPGTPLDDAPHAMAAVLNSLPVRVYAFHLLRAGVLAGSHRCTFYAGVLNALPVPARLLEDSDLVERLSELSRRAHREPDPDGRAQLQRLVDEELARAFGLDQRASAALRKRAGSEPLRTVLDAPRAGQPTRNIAVQAYESGQRYR
jgi:N-6 DNA Methylase